MVLGSRFRWRLHQWSQLCPRRPSSANYLSVVGLSCYVVVAGTSSLLFDLYLLLVVITSFNFRIALRSRLFPGITRYSRLRTLLARLPRNVFGFINDKHNKFHVARSYLLAEPVREYSSLVAPTWQRREMKKPIKCCPWRLSRVKK